MPYFGNSYGDIAQQVQSVAQRQADLELRARAMAEERARAEQQAGQSAWQDAFAALQAQNQAQQANRQFQFNAATADQDRAGRDTRLGLDAMQEARLRDQLNWQMGNQGKELGALFKDALDSEANGIKVADEVLSRFTPEQQALLLSRRKQVQKDLGEAFTNQKNMADTLNTSAKLETALAAGKENESVPWYRFGGAPSSVSPGMEAMANALRNQAAKIQGTRGLVADQLSYQPAEMRYAPRLQPPAGYVPPIAPVRVAQPPIPTGQALITVRLPSGATGTVTPDKLPAVLARGAVVVR